MPSSICVFDFYMRLILYTDEIPVLFLLEIFYWFRYLTMSSLDFMLEIYLKSLTLTGKAKPQLKKFAYFYSK